MDELDLTAAKSQATYIYKKIKEYVYWSTRIEVPQFVYHTTANKEYKELSIKIY